MGDSSEPSGIKVLHVEERYEDTQPLKLLHYGPGLGSLHQRLMRQESIKKRIERNEYMMENYFGTQYLDDGPIISQRYSTLEQLSKPVPGVSTQQCGH